MSRLLNARARVRARVRARAVAPALPLTTGRLRWAAAIAGCTTVAGAVVLFDPPVEPDGPDGGGPAPAPAVAPARTSIPEPVERERAPEPPPPCATPIAVFEGGAVAGQVCEDQLDDRGLTLIDLSDDWVPRMLTEAPDGEGGAQPYRERYLALARGTLGKGAGWLYARRDRYFELYGIPPTLSVIAARTADAERHRCHDAVDDTALHGFAEAVHELNNPAVARERRKLVGLQRTLERRARKLELASLDELAARGGRDRSQVESLRERVRRRDAVLAAQRHLACEGLLRGRYPEGFYNWLTSYAMGYYQRKHALMADGTLGGQTVAAMTADSRELDLAAALRVLRERVVDATGLIEDGSAREEYGTVFGRHLDAARYRRTTGHAPLADGAPDLISTFTEAAARQLGWTDPMAMAAFFAKHSLDQKVAVRLPDKPAYHRPDMELQVEIDRADVWYSAPRGASDKGCSAHWGERFPVLTVYAVDGDRRIPLVRWHTTIGGWNVERMPDGTRALRYKESDVGKRVWRDLVVSPAWFAPTTTPHADLVRRVNRRWELKRDTLGPSYRSAYGLVMLIHHRVRTLASGETIYQDRGIRTHGSANYMSILKGCSHGCHRLFNQQAVRLASFLLHHRRFVRHGRIEQRYSRVVRHRGRTFRAAIDNRGYRYELTPPVPINVLEGRIRGKQKRPFTGAIAIGPDDASAPTNGDDEAVVPSIGAGPIVDTPVQLDVPPRAGGDDAP